MIQYIEHQLFNSGSELQWGSWSKNQLIREL